MNHLSHVLRGILSCGLVLFLSFALTSAGQATSRVYVPMGTQVHQAALIAIADAAEGEKHSRVITLREILKGEAAQQGERITISQTAIFRTTYLKPDATGFAILLHPEWNTSKSPIIEIFYKPEEIEALRVLIDMEKQAGEKQRLIALRDRTFTTPASAVTPLLKAQLWAEFGQMREPANLPILLDLYDQVEEKDQQTVVELIGSIGDARGVPTLLKALESPSRSVALQASNPLTYQFHGAPRVTAAFQNLLKNATTGDDWRQSTAYWYLKQYDADVAAPFDPNRLAQYKASDAMKAANPAKALDELMIALRDNSQLTSLVLYLPETIKSVRDANRQQKDAIDAALMPGIKRLIETGTAYETKKAIDLLLTLDHPESEKLLLHSIAKNTKRDYEDATRVAAWELFGRSTEARAALLKAFASRPDWDVAQPIFAAGAQPDAGAALIEMLNELRALPGLTMENQYTRRWVIERLGKLREPRAVSPLIATLTAYGDNALIVAALHLLNSEQVEKSIEPLLRSPDRGLRIIAMDLIFARRGTDFLPDLRKMVSDASFGDQSSALLYLGRIGTVDDLKWLEPLTDFWKYPANHYWFKQAVTQLRQRHHYDINGPIRRVSQATG
jgi:HEAT repeat protein